MKPHEQYEKANDGILKEELPRLVGAQCATGDQWRNNFRKNEGMQPKQKPYPASRGDGIPVELFQILKDDAVKVLHSIRNQIWNPNSAVATGLEKVSFHSNPKERQSQKMLKLLHNCTHLTR